MKKLTALLVTLLLITALSGCTTDTPSTSIYDVEETPVVTKEPVADDTAKVESNAEAVTSTEDDLYPLTVVDKFGQEVIIEAEPMKVISMSPEITEIIFALGANDKLIGRSSYCDYPAETANIVDFGTLLDVNIESVVAAEPDVIFLSSMASEESTMMLRDQGLTVVIFDQDTSLEQTYDYYMGVGQVLNKEKEAMTLTETVKAQIAAVSEKVAGLEAPRVYYVVYAGDGYDSTATGDTFIHNMIQLANGINVAQKGTNWGYSVEQLVEDDPYLMVCSMRWETKAKIQGLEGYKDLTAVLEDRLYEVDENIFSRQGPRIGEAVEVLATIFHPEAFK